MGNGHLFTIEEFFRTVERTRYHNLEEVMEVMRMHPNPAPDAPGPLETSRAQPPLYTNDPAIHSLLTFFQCMKETNYSTLDSVSKLIRENPHPCRHETTETFPYSPSNSFVYGEELVTRCLTCREELGSVTYNLHGEEISRT